MTRLPRVSTRSLMLGLVLTLTLLGCAPGPANSVVIYTSLDQPFSEPILRDFEAATGVRVQPVYDVEAAKSFYCEVFGWTTNDMDMENGIYTFGVGLVRESPLLVELGVMLDVFVAVLVMGVAVFHISREFDHIDVDQLTHLKD